MRQLKAQNVDPATIAPIDLNKTERQLFAGFGAMALREMAVAGTGRDATFRDFSLVNRPFMRADNRFFASVRPYQEQNRDRIVELYDRGDDPEHQWWSLARQRCRRLGFRAVAKVGARVPLDGIFLDFGLTTLAFGSALAKHIVTVNDCLQAPPAERVHAATTFCTYPFLAQLCISNNLGSSAACLVHPPRSYKMRLGYTA